MATLRFRITGAYGKHSLFLERFRGWGNCGLVKEILQYLPRRLYVCLINKIFFFFRKGSYHFHGKIKAHDSMEGNNSD